MVRPSMCWLAASALLLPTSSLVPAGHTFPSGHLPGEKLPKGPPWHVVYRSARRDALRTGKPVYVYFTKSY